MEKPHCIAAAASTLCLLIQLSTKWCLCGCFGGVLMKAKEDIKEGIKQTPLFVEIWLTTSQSVLLSQRQQKMAIF